MGAAQTGAGLAIPPPMACSFPFPSTSPRCCPIDRCRRKYDPSRGGVGSVPGRPAGGRGDRAVPPGFAGVAGWPAAAVPALLSFGTCPRSSDVPGSRNCRCKTPTRNPASGKTTAVTPLLWPSHPARGWNNDPLSWHAGYAVVVPSNRGRHKKPRSLARSGVSPFHLRPCLAGASANRRLRCVPTPCRWGITNNALKEGLLEKRKRVLDQPDRCYSFGPRCAVASWSTQSSSS